MERTFVVRGRHMRSRELAKSAPEDGIVADALYTITETCALQKTSRSQVYVHIANGEYQDGVVKDGRLTKICGWAIRDRIARLPRVHAAQGPKAPAEASSPRNRTRASPNGTDDLA